MRVAEELRKHADLAIKEGGMYYSGEYLDAIASRAESEQAENAKLRELCSALYEFAYDEYPDSAELNFADRLRELGVEV